MSKTASIKKTYERAQNLKVEWMDKFVAFVVDPGHSEHRVGITGITRYTVRCDCKWSIYGGDGCSHSIAAVIDKARKLGRTARFYAVREQAVKQRQMMRQIADDLWVVMRPAGRLS